MEPTASRSAEKLLAIVRGLDVRRNFAFMPRPDGTTHCNGYVNAVSVALGVPVPPILANDQRDWLADPSHGWQPVDRETARMRAEVGFPTIAIWKNSSGGHGHVAFVVPAPDSAAGELYVTAAGRENFDSAAIEKSFGLSIEPEFFTRD